jgi:hypothetical protein
LSSANPLILLVLTLAWSWAWWGASIALGGTETAGGGLTWLVGGFGPTIGVGFALLRGTPQYRSSFRHRLLKWNVPWIFWLAAVAFATGPKLIALAIAAVAGHSAHGDAIGLGEVPVTIVFSVIVVAIEEPLWRGVALDAFRPAVVRASLVIGFFWSLWHVPLFAVDGTFQEELGLGTLDFWVFSVGVVGLSVFLTWLVVSASGSILLAMFTHLLINLTGQLLPDDTTIRVLEMVVILLVAGVLLSMRRNWGARVSG